jgi:hypothetical protein
MPAIMSAGALTTNKPATFLHFLKRENCGICNFFAAKVAESATFLPPYPVGDKVRRQRGGVGGLPPQESC